MPRDISGNYTLPAGNPVVSGTVIATTWANPTLSDVGQNLTDSLDRFGRGGMLAALRLLDGTAAVPALAWSSETGSGLYRVGAGTIGFSTLATQRLTINGTGNVVINSPSSGVPLTATTAATSGGIINAGLLSLSAGYIGVNRPALLSTNLLDIGTTAANSLSFFTGSVFRLVVNSTGNIDIAAPSSGVALTVNSFGSAVGVQVNTPPATTGLFLGAGGSTTGACVASVNNTGGSFTWGLESSTGGTVFPGASAYAAILGNSTSTDMLFYTNNVRRLTIASAGNVTINAPSSGVPLTITTSSGALNTRYVGRTGDNISTIEFYDNTITTELARIQCFSGSLAIAAASTNFLAFNTNALSRMTIGGSGNVAIAAPSSGVALTIGTGANGTSGLSVCGATLNRGQSFVSNATEFLSTNQFIIGTNAASTVELWTNSVQRLGVGTAGNVTINAPSSGNALTVAGFAGSDTALFNGGTSGSFRVTDRGLPYGTSIHNNAGPVTGTTNQYIASGTYTPTPANLNNTSALSGNASQWIRVGNVVTVSGSVSFTITSASTSTTLSLTLPIASNLIVATNCAGTAAFLNSALLAPTAIIFGDTSTDLAFLGFLSNATTGAVTYYFTFTYLIQ